MTVDDARRITYKDALYAIYWRNADGRRWIRRGDIITYFDETFLTAVDLWRMWRMFGLPHGGGWMDERPRVTEAIATVEEERLFYESRHTEESRKKAAHRAHR